jgi:hypothetical protein
LLLSPSLTRIFISDLMSGIECFFGDRLFFFG